MAPYIGTIYLFGFIPIARGLYAADLWQQDDWHIQPWIRWACVIRWRKERGEV